MAAKPCVGRDSADPVTKDYPGEHPWTFTGGTIKRVLVDASGDPFVNIEHEAAMALKRD